MGFDEYLNNFKLPEQFDSVIETIKQLCRLCYAKGYTQCQADIISDIDIELINELISLYSNEP